MTLRRSIALVNQQNGYRINNVINGEFETDINVNWAGNNATLSAVPDGTTGNYLQVAINGGSSGYAQQAIATRKNHVYQVTLKVKRVSGIGAFINVLDDQLIKLGGIDLVDDDQFVSMQLWFKAASDICYLQLGSSGSVNDACQFDDVELVDITSGLAKLLSGMVIYICSGDQSGSASDAILGDILCTVTNNSNGLTFTALNDSTVVNESSETWSGIILKTGVAAVFRIAYPEDDITLSDLAAYRMDGDIGVLPDFLMRMGGTTLVVGQPDVTIREFNYRVNYNGD